MAGLVTYADFQNKTVSEKVGLVTVDAAKRLMGWVLDSGAIYRIDNFQVQAFIGLEDSGTPYTAVGSIGALGVSKYFWDRTNAKLYAQVSDSTNPNGKFLISKQRFFFSNLPIIAPWDLGSGFDVSWAPSLESTSNFGVELDQINLGAAIEGAGSVTIKNDQTFWRPIFDSLFFENQAIGIYSWNRQLPITEAKIIFKGSIQTKKYTTSHIEFGLKDALNGLRAPLTLPTLSAYTSSTMTTAVMAFRQRRIYGYKKNVQCQSIMMVPPDIGAPSGIDFTFKAASTTVTTTDPRLLDKIYKDDLISPDNIRWYKVKSVDAVNSLTLSEYYYGLSLTNSNTRIIPAKPTEYFNRTYHISSHPLNEPATTITSVLSATQFTVANSAGINAGDRVGIDIYHNILVLRVNGNTLKLAAPLGDTPSLIFPTIGMNIVRYAVQAVYIDGSPVPFAHYYYENGTPSQLKFDRYAEVATAIPTLLKGSVTSDVAGVVTGLGTLFTSEVKLKDYITQPTQLYASKVASIQSDTQLMTTYVSSLIAGHASIITPNTLTDSSTVTIDVYGATDTGLISGKLLESGPEIIQDILNVMGLGSNIELTSFANARDSSPFKLSLCMPEKFNDVSVINARDTINKINASCLGALVMNSDFKFVYTILTPERPQALMPLFREVDILKLSVTTYADKTIFRANINYDAREFEPAALSPTYKVVQAINLIGTYVAKVIREKTIDTYLTNLTDAQIVANRYAFLMEIGRSSVTLETKLQASRLTVTDKVDINHEKLYYRIGSSGTRKIAEITKAHKSITGSTLELDDLANGLSRCGVITLDSAPNFAGSNDEAKLYAGYITDQFGMIGNNGDTFNINLQW